MNQAIPLRFRRIADYHAFRDMPGPAHPLISVINLDAVPCSASRNEAVSLVFDFYSISLKQVASARMRYGQQAYDFENGIMAFMAPGQVFSIGPAPEGQPRPSGRILLVHPDLLWSTALAQKMQRYEYFGYAVHEALHLSEKEEATIAGLVESIDGECRSNIDRFSSDVIIAQLELLLTYAERFYQRQFITRKISAHRMLDRFEALLTAHFAGDAAAQGLPTVQSIAGALAVSPNYLSGLLKTLTGQSTQQHIHDKLIERAKERLSTTDLTVSEIAYELGFEHSQSFSKLFKTKTALSPLAFRASFN